MTTFDWFFSDRDKGMQSSLKALFVCRAARFVNSASSGFLLR
jgi:hypothetical protein